MSRADPDLGLAHAALWADTRIAVVDVETCRSDDGGRIVAVAVVTCRKGKPTGSWSSLANPGVPIDADSSRIHGITDAHVADEPPFAELAPTVQRLLAPADDERLVVAGHNVGFDLARLHAELAPLGRELADLPLLDTMTLPAAVGITTRRRRLKAVLDALGLVNPTPHDAASDAAATAQAVITLLEHAAAAGWDDLDALLRHAAGRKPHTSSQVPASTTDGARRRETDEGERLPAEHAASHTELLPAEPSDTELAAWRAAVDECVQLRCAHLADRVEAAQAPGRLLLAELEASLQQALDAHDAAAAATVLGALTALFGQLDGRKEALAWHDRWADAIAAVGRCGDDGRCPACRAEAPCPADVWHHHLAATALGNPARFAENFLPSTGERAGAGVFATWRRDGRHRLADYTAWLAWTYWHHADQPSTAATVARLAWEAGCRDPRLVNVYAGLLAASGTTAALDQAISACDHALAGRGGDTDGGWRQVAIRRSQLAGRRAQRTTRITGVDADGNPVHARRHHPQQPRRLRPRRFKLE